MKLTYRGITQEYDIPSIEVLEGEVGGKYRGQNWNYRYPRHIPVPQQTYDLKYRGVSYSTNPAPKAEVAVAEPVAEPAPFWGTQAVSLMGSTLNLSFSKPVPETVAKVHRTNICNLLERRLQAAKARGDEALVRLLESEAAQLTCAC